MREENFESKTISLPKKEYYSGKQMKNEPSSKSRRGKLLNQKQLVFQRKHLIGKTNEKRTEFSKVEKGKFWVKNN